MSLLDRYEQMAVLFDKQPMVDHRAPESARQLLELSRLLREAGLPQPLGMPLHDVSTQGIDSWGTWTPGWTGFSANPAVSFARFLIVGPICFINYGESSLGTSNSSSFTLTGLPVPAAAIAGLHPIRVTDNGSAQSNPGRVSFSGQVATLALNLGGTGFTSSGAKGASIVAWYEIAA